MKACHRLPSAWHALDEVVTSRGTEATHMIQVPEACQWIKWCYFCLKGKVKEKNRITWMSPNFSVSWLLPPPARNKSFTKNQCYGLLMVRFLVKEHGDTSLPWGSLRVVRRVTGKWQPRQPRHDHVAAGDSRWSKIIVRATSFTSNCVFRRAVYVFLSINVWKLQFYHIISVPFQQFMFLVRRYLALFRFIHVA